MGPLLARVVAAMSDFETHPVGTANCIKALVEALTPSGDTKAAYMGEFHFPQTMTGDDGEDVTVKTYVPWTTVKEIMAAIRARAALDRIKKKI
jgi:hypothetical protein